MRPDLGDPDLATPPIALPRSEASYNHLSRERVIEKPWLIIIFWF